MIMRRLSAMNRVSTPLLVRGGPLGLEVYSDDSQGRLPPVRVESFRNLHNPSAVSPWWLVGATAVSAAECGGPEGEMWRLGTS
jgi:hypothetical protein